MYADPGETTDLADTAPTTLTKMVARLEHMAPAVWSPWHGHKDQAACNAAVARGMVWGPWVPMTEVVAVASANEEKFGTPSPDNNLIKLTIEFVLEKFSMAFSAIALSAFK